MNRANIRTLGVEQRYTFGVRLFYRLMEAPLYRYDDVYDVAADAVRCIDARLERRGLQLEPAAGEALRTALEGVLRLAEVQEVA